MYPEVGGRQFKPFVCVRRIFADARGARGGELEALGSCADLIRGAKLGEPAPRDKPVRERRLRRTSGARQAWR
jgi:hypothetical protein